MERLLVYADFDWLSEAELVGELTYETLRGAESYGFRFSDTWLGRHGDLLLSADLSNYSGAQYNKEGRGLFGCLDDALPDRWGRTLIARREQIIAAEDKRPVRRLSAFDYLTAIDDFSRMGALRFKISQNGGYINQEDRLSVPPLADLRQLACASLNFEISEADNRTPEKRWIMQLLRPGSSLGGARPKASVLDDDGTLCVAKFPSLSDDYDVALWEHFCHLLAREAGVSAADTRVVALGGKHHTLLSRRFDRSNTRRIHFASAMTLLGLRDGDNASTGHGYLDIVGFIIQGCTEVERNLREIFRRAAFNICVGNSDDHFRNHGFLLTSKGWTLSPAYDMNPTLNPFQSLLVTPVTNEADLRALLGACDEYLLRPDEGERIIREVAVAVRGWRKLAAKLCLPQSEAERFGPLFDSRVRQVLG
ncbi:MAG: type II toxin-antitoxin system HipA family toxin [Prevotellaceae bacterium]|nr:type II toxin-antitoxin system HipA family toxin [Prevotellaceae bacterium]